MTFSLGKKNTTLAVVAPADKGVARVLSSSAAKWADGKKGGGTAAGAKSTI